MLREVIILILLHPDLVAVMAEEDHGEDTVLTQTQAAEVANLSQSRETSTFPRIIVQIEPQLKF